MTIPRQEPVHWGDHQSTDLPNISGSSVTTPNLQIGDFAYDTTLSAVRYATTVAQGSATWKSLFAADGSVPATGDFDMAGFSLTSAGYLSLSEQGSDPATVTNHGHLYTKDVNGSPELFYQNDQGIISQVSGISQSLQTAYEAGNAVAVTDLNGSVTFSRAGTETVSTVTITKTGSDGAAALLVGVNDNGTPAIDITGGTGDGYIALPDTGGSSGSGSIRFASGAAIFSPFGNYLKLQGPTGLGGIELTDNYLLIRQGDGELRFNGTSEYIARESGDELGFYAGNVKSLGVEDDRVIAYTYLGLPEHVGDPTNVADQGFIYTKDVNTVTELFYIDSAGTVTQITNQGASTFDTLQDAYDNSTGGSIVLDGTHGAFQIRDNATPIGSDLFTVSDNGVTTQWLAVDATGVFSLARDGATSAPSYGFAGAPNTGLYMHNTGVPAITANGTRSLTVVDTHVSINTGQVKIGSGGAQIDGTSSVDYGANEAGSGYSHRFYSKLDLSGSSGGHSFLDVEFTVNQSNSAFYDGARVDVTENGLGSGADDPDGIGNTLHRWRVDTGTGLATVAAITNTGGILGQPGGANGFTFIGKGTAGMRLSTNDLILASASGVSDVHIVSSDAVYARHSAVNVFAAKADPGTPVDGDTNIAIREHQDNGGVTANLSDVSLTSMVVDGVRVMGVADRSAGQAVTVDANGRLSAKQPTVTVTADETAADSHSFDIRNCDTDAAAGDIEINVPTGLTTGTVITYQKVGNGGDVLFVGTGLAHGSVKIIQQYGTATLYIDDTGFGVVTGNLDTSTVSLQDAYEQGPTISTTDAQGLFEVNVPAGNTIAAARIQQEGSGSHLELEDSSAVQAALSATDGGFTFWGHDPSVGFVKQSGRLAYALDTDGDAGLIVSSAPNVGAGEFTALIQGAYLQNAIYGGSTTGTHDLIWLETVTGTGGSDGPGGSSPTFRVTDGGLVETQDGSDTAPAYSFTGNNTVGLYRTGTGGAGLQFNNNSSITESGNQIQIEAETVLSIFSDAGLRFQHANPLLSSTNLNDVLSLGTNNMAAVNILRDIDATDDVSVDIIPAVTIADGENYTALRVNPDHTGIGGTSGDLRLLDLQVTGVSQAYFDEAGALFFDQVGQTGASLKAGVLDFNTDFTIQAGNLNHQLSLTNSTFTVKIGGSDIAQVLSSGALRLQSNSYTYTWNNNNASLGTNANEQLVLTAGSVASDLVLDNASGTFQVDAADASALELLIGSSSVITMKELLDTDTDVAQHSTHVVTVGSGESFTGLVYDFDASGMDPAATVSALLTIRSDEGAGFNSVFTIGEAGILQDVGADEHPDSTNGAGRIENQTMEWIDFSDLAAGHKIAIFS